MRNILERGKEQEIKGEGASRNERRDERYVKETEREKEVERHRGRRDGGEGGVCRGWMSLDRAFALL